MFATKVSTRSAAEVGVGQLSPVTDLAAQEVTANGVGAALISDYLAPLRASAFASRRCSNEIERAARRAFRELLSRLNSGKALTLSEWFLVGEVAATRFGRSPADGSC